MNDTATFEADHEVRDGIGRISTGA